jgi:hypothetical protein
MNSAAPASAAFTLTPAPAGDSGDEETYEARQQPMMVLMMFRTNAFDCGNNSNSKKQ